MNYIGQYGAGDFTPIKRDLSNEEHKALLKKAHQILKAKRQTNQTTYQREEVEQVPLHRIKPLMLRVGRLEKLLKEKPNKFNKPKYGTLDYYIAKKQGWISNEDEQLDRTRYDARRKRSLQKCNRYSKKWFYIEHKPEILSGKNYTPEVAATILNDQSLTDGARRFALKLMEVTYRENRKGRTLETTVSYLANMLGRHKRTIQNYLSLLESRGYIKADVVVSKLTKMSLGLLITLGEQLFPEHHQEKWAEKRRNSGVQSNSFKIVQINKTSLISRFTWANQCMEGIYESFQKYCSPQLS